MGPLLQKGSHPLPTPLQKQIAKNTLWVILRAISA